MVVKFAAARLGRQALLWGVVAVCGAVAAVAAEHAFPFEQELLLDTAPMRGSNRVPGIEVLNNGWATIDLWCASGRGRVQVDGAAISIVPQSMTPAACPPERSQRDADFLAVLTQVTTWRLEGDTLVLIGPQTLRYRVSSH
jgi:heat shock protein HslJ